MTTSNTYTTSNTRNILLKDALIAAGVQDAEEDMDAADAATAARIMNRVLGEWKNQGLQLWLHRNCFLYLEDNKFSYKLGPDGDSMFELSDLESSRIETTTTVAEVAGNTSITVDDASLFTVTDSLLIRNADGETEKVTITSIDTDTKVIEVSALTYDHAIGSEVWKYREAQKPMRVFDVNRRNYTDQYETQLHSDSKSDFWRYYNKNSPGGTPNTWAYIPRRNIGMLYVWPMPDTWDWVLHMTVDYPFEIFTNAEDELDAPAEVVQALVYRTAELLAIEYDASDTRYRRLRGIASETFQAVLDWDQEQARISVEPDLFPYWGNN